MAISLCLTRDGGGFWNYFWINLLRTLNELVLSKVQGSIRSDAIDHTFVRSNCRFIFCSHVFELTLAWLADLVMSPNMMLFK